MSAPWLVPIAVVICALSSRRVLMIADGSLPVSGCERRLESDGRSAAPGVWFPTLVATLVMGVLFGAWIAAVVGGLVTAVMISPARQALARRRDVERFRGALPQYIEELARGLRGGLSPSQALIEGAAVAPAPFPEAFQPVATLLASGSTAGDAVKAWADRRNDLGIRFLATAMAVGTAVGGIDARSADAVAVALRERNSTEAIVRVQATQAFYSAGVLCGAPVLFCALVVLTDQRSSTFLLRSPAGRLVGFAGIALDLVGALWMRRMVRRVVR